MVQKQYIFLGLCVVAGVGCVLVGRFVYTQIISVQVPFIPREVHTVLQPPKSSLTAQIKIINGEVEKQGRNDTDFHKITKPDSLVVGESIATKRGSVVYNVGQDIALTLGNNTQLDYLNGLPHAMVVRQPMGTILYSISSLTSLPFSVRSLGLLTQFSSTTKTSIATDATNQTVTVTVLSGSAIVAYSDEKDITQVKNLTKGDRAFFDYTQSTLIME